MAITINASTSSGLIQSADNSGIIQFQSNGSTKATLSSSGFSYPGAVLQVVSASTTTRTSTTSTSFVDCTNVTASITPTSSSSKILVIVSIQGLYLPSGGSNNDNIGVKLLRGSTDINIMAGQLFYRNSTSGSITLQEPAVAGTTVLSLPATSGTLITTGSSGQSIPKAALPTGSVLQVVQSEYSTQVSLSSTTFVATTLSASITPTSSSSKVLILVNGVALSNSTSYQCLQTIYRNSTNLGSGTGFTFVNLIQDTATSMSCLDSPATTSSTTYTVYIRTNNASGIAYFGDSVGGTFQTSVMTLMEIAA